MSQNYQRVKELDISLDDLHAVIEALDDHAAVMALPHYQTYLQDLSERLLGLWSYWSARTKRTDSFMLRIKRM